MHGPDFDQRRRIWLIAGTGEGPVLAAALLRHGWQLSVAVVSQTASRVYPTHPALKLEVGPLDGAAAMAQRLAQAHSEGNPFAWVVDASHPFASRVTADLARACGWSGQPLLRLERPLLMAPAGLDRTVLPDLEGLGRLDLRGDRLLFAIGARHLRQAVALAAAAVPFARLLPSPESLRLGRAAGLADDQLACHRPGRNAGWPEFTLERALLRHWSVTTVLCRQSGGPTEHGWQSLCSNLGLRLLLLARPAEPPAGTRLELEAIVEMIGAPGLSPGGWRPDPAGRPGSGDPAG
ncbi:precorrin-6A/cobalt-precorrin-6A reductase [Synechococcus sp. CS-1325]|uniref:precorrin-6A/cobalt-precorrin-6A reductase n=1 Tax=Synechococcus sp. CS-1325 TaxID=2847979 RepID=UPI000DB28FE9|nr:precorrin-6A/cobalt-precorrin-6A reductase [Synechococcus sp. CS-1325]MCT0199510.1 precorrin-6A/cobalt-precorrin-6A reductase [Synechococcus sp. CS-1325]PZV02541.1 MAG: precorrin-6A reductase [Cyanobium sp.]